MTVTFSLANGQMIDHFSVTLSELVSEIDSEIVGNKDMSTMVASSN